MKKRQQTVEADYEQALARAKRALASLPFAHGFTEDVRGLRGWVFEQTLHSRLHKAMTRRGVNATIEHQVSIGGRATIDLLIGHAAIEAKVSGFYEDVGARYRRYRKRAEERGWHYFYVTLYETYEPNVRMARKIFGRHRAFFLDRPGHWSRLVSTITRLQKK